MINELVSRPNIQHFLNKYPSCMWKDLLADIFEIGVLNLRNSFHRDEFSKNEFYNIIYDLEHTTPRIQPQNNNLTINLYKNSNFSNIGKNSNFGKSASQYYANCHWKYDYDRRRRRLKKLEKREHTDQMDAFYSELNETPKKKSNYKLRRSHKEIVDKILRSKQLRDAQRYQIRDLKQKYMLYGQRQLQKKLMEKQIEKKAEEDIKEQENEKRRQKMEEDYKEGYGEDYQEENEIEEEEDDKYNNYNEGYYDGEEEEEGGEQEEYQGEEDQGEEYQGEEYQGEEYQGDEEQGEEYQEGGYQGEEYQGEEEGYQEQDYQGQEQQNMIYQ